jgi:hypothetical protein
MRRARRRLRAWLAGMAAVFVALVLLAGGTSFLGGGDPEPASRAALDRIAAKNREAAIVSAARLKAESEAATAAADARLAETGQGGPIEPER